MIKLYNLYEKEFEQIDGKLITNWLKSVVKNENKSIGKISMIFVDDNYLLDVNIKYLKHNYFTDIITFNYNQGLNISGDLYISIDTIKSNAEFYQTNFKNELLELYESYIIVDFVPTSENISAWLLKIVQNKMDKLNIKVSKVEFLETPKSKSTFYARS